jgi:2-hydroxychromene-2-carboxylate isomerase
VQVVAEPLAVTLYSDPLCPWAYSANPAFRALEWRYGDQLDWRLVLIGLSESYEQNVKRGATPLRSAQGYLRYRRFGMPIAPSPRARVIVSARACRAAVAARLTSPGSEFAVFRALQFAAFTTPLLLDDDADLTRALEGVPGIDASDIVSRLDDSEVVAAYQSDRAEARSAAGSPAELQGKTSTSDGPVRFTAPSVTFGVNGQRLVAGGWQPLAAYDVCVANLVPDIERRAQPEDVGVVLEAFPAGLTTYEAATVLAAANDEPDGAGTERALLELVADGRARRAPLGDDAIWRPSQV